MAESFCRAHFEFSPEALQRLTLAQRDALMLVSRKAEKAIVGVWMDLPEGYVGVHLEGSASGIVAAGISPEGDTST